VFLHEVLRQLFGENCNFLDQLYQSRYRPIFGIAAPSTNAPWVTSNIPTPLFTALASELTSSIHGLVQHFQPLSRALQEIHLANYIEDVAFWVLQDATQVPAFLRELCER
jgi:hypothetical protein